MHLHDQTNNQKMNSKQIALAMIVISFMFLGMAFLTGCAGFKNPSVCLKTDYGTFCYELPEIKGLKK